MGWSFALMNGRLAEIFFDHKKNGEPIIRGFCYVSKSEYKTKKERLWIKTDTKRYHFTYKNKKYFDRIRKMPVHSAPFPRR
jgi:hypothetical protein